MHNPNFFFGRERQLRNMINNAGKYDIAMAACAGVDPNIYHPEQGPPNDLALARCTECPARLACLALALRAEDPETRAGWYGGLGPADRDDIAALLRLDTPQPPTPDRAVEATRLRTAGWTVNDIAAHLGCSRRTVQRDLREAA